MITADLFKKEEQIITVGDSSLKCPKGKRTFYAFVTFEDYSTVHWTNFFASNRTEAIKQILDRFADCTEYIQDISIHEWKY
ncbi:MAG: hypothetical protein PUD26_05390 [bacterium]|nr:hypothetical protein [bacterium]